MEAPGLACPASPARDQPAPAPGLPGAPGGQTSPHPTLGPVLLPPEQGLAPTVFLKALPLPLYHTVPPGSLQPRAPLLAGSLEGGGMPFLLGPLLQPEGPGAIRIRKPATPTLTVSLVGALPVLSPGPGPALGGFGKTRPTSRYLCPHCGRDCLKPSVLEKHIRSHTGERPFPCATCGIAFKTQSNLYKHRRTQTHLNNSRLCAGPHGPGGGLPEEGGKAGEASGAAAGKGDGWSPSGSDGALPDRPFSPGVHGALLSPAAKHLDLKPEAPAGAQLRRPLQQVASAEKPWDAKAAEGRLRKCESTDSGYLSRSDSVEQPPAAGSPLHSLSEHSVESEGQGAAGAGGARAEQGGRGPSLELEKRQLEERIARLISHNQAVVEDPQLDHVRPRKTVLSKQGSIDLPVPYTYKDSFHFEIRAPEPGRRRGGALGPARSTCAPPDKARPLFFHSVPTQLSTTVECVPVTRSNSLPSVEGVRAWQEPLDAQGACPRRQKTLSPRPVPARLAGVLGNHPRALVRQTAVEDLLCPPTRDTPTPAEDVDRKRTGAGSGDDGAAGQGRAAGRRGSRRRPKMFSQEKWQMYGRETFQRLYQGAGAGGPGGRKARGRSAGQGVGLDLPPQAEAVGGEGAALSPDTRDPACGDTPAGASSGPLGSLPATEGFLGIKSPKQKGAQAGSSEEPAVSRPASPPALSCSKSPRLPPRGRPPAPGPLEGGELQAPKPLPDSRLGGGTPGGGDSEEPCQQALAVPSWPSGGSGEPRPAEPQPPSEKKKLRVEVQSSPGTPGPRGARVQASGLPGQAASLPSWNQDGDPGDKEPRLRCSAEDTGGGRARPPEASGAPFVASSAASRPVGPRDQEHALGPAAGVPRGHSPLVPQPQAPDVLGASTTDATFPPKYLLRLPQEDAPPPLPGAQGPPFGSRWPEDLASCTGPGPGPLLPPCPATGRARGGPDSRRDEPSQSRLRGRTKGVSGEAEGGSDTSTPEGGASPGLRAGAPREKASALPAWACDSPVGETGHTGQLCTGGTWARARPSGGALDPWPLSQDVGELPGNGPEDPSPGPAAGRRPCCSLRPSSVLSVPPALSWPGLASGAPSEGPGSGRPRGPFPSMRAEPQLTWCCFSRSLPLPTEPQKAASVPWALHGLEGRSPGQGVGARPVSKAASGGQTRTSPAGGETHAWKLSYLTAPGATSRDPGSQPARETGPPPRRRTHVPRGRSRQRQLRRYRGSFLQSRVQLTVRRLRKPVWVPRKDGQPPRLEGMDPRRTLGKAASETAGLRLQGELSRASAALPLGCGNGEEEEEEEEDRRPVSRGVSPSASPKERDTFTVQDSVPSEGEHGDCFPDNTSVGSGSSLPPKPCAQVAGAGPLPRGQGLCVGRPEAPQLPSQDRVSADPKRCISSDAQGPSAFKSQGNSLCLDVATSAVAACMSPGARGGPAAPGTGRTEPRGPGGAAGRALTRGSRDGNAVVQGSSLSLPPMEPSPEQRLSGSVPLRSPGKAHFETPVSGSTRSHREGGPETSLPSGGRPGCGAVLASCPPAGRDGEKGRESAFVVPEDREAPSKPGQPAEVPQAPSQTVKKRSSEGARKQSRAAFSDTSSDDEDRLVIEI